jgi:hypothetical protein
VHRGRRVGTPGAAAAASDCCGPPGRRAVCRLITVSRDGSHGGREPWRRGDFYNRHSRRLCGSCRSALA